MVFRQKDLEIQKGERLIWTNKKNEEVPFTVKTVSKKTGKIYGLTADGEEIYIPKTSNLKYGYYKDTDKNLDKELSYIKSQIVDTQVEQRKNNHLINHLSKLYVDQSLNKNDVQIVINNDLSKHKLNIQIRSMLQKNKLLTGNETTLGSDDKPTIKANIGEKIQLKTDHKTDDLNLKSGEDFQIIDMNKQEITLENSQKEHIIIDPKNEVFNKMSYGYAKMSLDVNEHSNINKEALTYMSVDGVDKVSNRSFMSALSNYKSINVTTENAKELDNKLSARFEESVNLPSKNHDPPIQEKSTKAIKQELQSLGM